MGEDALHELVGIPQFGGAPGDLGKGADAGHALVLELVAIGYALAPAVGLQADEVAALEWPGTSISGITVIPGLLAYATMSRTCS